MQAKRPFDAAPPPFREADEALAPVIRLRPIRTLVVSPDLAYHERAMTVLGGLGRVVRAVAGLSQPGDITHLVAQERPDVVLLDATGCESAAHKIIAALAESAPRTGVVTVCHHCTKAARELDALPKWGWTQDLRAGVELAYREGNPLSPLARRSLHRRHRWQRTAGPLPPR